MLPAPLDALAKAGDGLIRGRQVHTIDLDEWAAESSASAHSALDAGENKVGVEQSRALVFLREFVRKSRPIVIEDSGVHAWPALSLWTSDYMAKAIGSENESRTTTVRVNSTPNGRADAVYFVAKSDRLRENAYRVRDADLARAPAENGSRRDTDECFTVFAQPQELHISAPAFFDWLREDTIAWARGNGPVDGHVLYLSAQNSNFESDTELASLLRDLAPGGVPPHAPVPSPASLAPQFAVQAFGCTPDAVNLWIGNARSVSSLHHDPYDNLYVVVRGEKRFTLLPPCDTGLLDEKNYPNARFRRREHLGQSGNLQQSLNVEQVDGDGIAADDDDSTSEKKSWELLVDENASQTPWIAIDPDATSSEQDGVPRALFDQRAKPVRVSVSAGQMLYLPANWYHQVSHGEGDEDGKSVAVNFWFDQPYDSLAYCQGMFLEAAVEHWRGTGELSQNEK